MADLELAGSGALFVGGDDEADSAGCGHQYALHVQKPCGVAHCLAGRPVLAVDVVIFKPYRDASLGVVRSRTARSVASTVCSR